MRLNKCSKKYHMNQVTYTDDIKSQFRIQVGTTFFLQKESKKRKVIVFVLDDIATHAYL